MAVNKNFVVKNGLEVNDNLLVADQTTEKVGIGTSVSYYTLHVQGGIGATEARVTGVSTFVGDVHAESQLSVTGVTTLASAGGITTTGGDLYIGGDLYVLDDVVYDEVNGRNIYISGVSTFVGVSSFLNNVIIAGVTTLAQQGGITTTGGDLYVGGDLFVLDDIVYDEVTGRNLNITGISTFAYADINDGDIVVDALDVTGVTTGARFLATDVSVSGVATITVARVAGIATINANGAQITGLSTFDGNVHLPDNKSVYFGGTPGTTTGDLQLFHDASHSYIRDQGTGDVRVRASGFDVRDSANALSILRADASGFMATTGIATVGVASITDVVVSGASTFTGVGTFLSDLYVGGSAYITGDLTFDEFTARNASITGITTTTNLHVGTGGTVINATAEGVVQIGSGTTLATVTINGGSIPSVGLVIALGG